ncbi:MAG: hypothetical protein E6Q78_08055 [Rhodoferax sp.]|nr:MAG: hypothetical protein E6Q78_08055 [Rhodoferax sp.]
MAARIPVPDGRAPPPVVKWRPNPMCLRGLIAVVLAGWALAAGAQMRYVYPPPESANDHRTDYYWRLLGAALQATESRWGPYEVVPSGVAMNSDRAQMLLTRSDTVTVIARTTSTERESTLTPIRIPLDKGLTGYRLFLIQKPLQERLRKVRTLDDLKAFPIGQKSQWVDVDILQAVGLQVVGALDYESLFRMLPAGRFDLLSRGVNEIYQEWEVHRPDNPDLAIERSLLLYYPLPRYFFFAPTPQGERLAQRVREGLERLQANKEFERLYQVYKREILSGLDLSGRRLLRIPNPQLPAQTPLGKAAYWDDLQAERSGPAAP